MEETTIISNVTNTHTNQDSITSHSHHHRWQRKRRRILLLIGFALLLFASVAGIYLIDFEYLDKTNFSRRSRNFNDEDGLDYMNLSLSEKRAIVQTSLSNYSWVGNHWIPPVHVPTFSARQMRQFFQRHDLLSIGDSMGRRAYVSMYNVMNAEDIDNVPERDIELNIDVNKKNPDEELCVAPDREYFYNETYISDQTILCRNIGISKRKFDYVRANCMKNVYDIFSTDIDANELNYTRSFHHNIRHSDKVINFRDALKDYEIVVIT